MKKGRLGLALFTLMFSVVPLDVLADTDITVSNKKTTDSMDNIAENQSTTSSEGSTETEPINNEEQKEDAESSISSAESEKNLNKSVIAETETTTDSIIASSETDNTLESESVDVYTNDDLKNALLNTNVERINVKKNLELGNAKFPVNHNVVIDGDGNTIFYGASGTMTMDMGISFASDDIKIKIKNLTFGGSFSSQPLYNSNNPYGCVTQGSSDRKGCSLILENVNYSSSYGANVCTFNDPSNEVILDGENSFEQRSFGSHDEPGWEEEQSVPMIYAGKITIKENSNTTFYSTLESCYGLFEGDSGLTINVEHNAKVEILAYKFLFGTEKGESGDCNLNVGDGAEFTLNNWLEGSEIFNVPKVDQKDRINIKTGEQSILNILLYNYCIMNPVNVSLGKDSETVFSDVSNYYASMFGNEINNQITNIDFTLNDIAFLEVNNEVCFAPEDEPITSTYGPFAVQYKLKGSIQFKGSSYEIESKGEDGSNSQTFHQKRNSSWQFDDNGISTKGVKDFESYQSNLQESNYIRISKSDMVDEKEIVVSEIWVDDDNSYGLKPETTSFQMKANDTELDKSYENSALNAWSQEITLPDKDGEGNPIKYSVVAKEVPNYYTEVRLNGEDFEIIHTLKKVLKFLKVPEPLKWTDRTIPFPDTILNRDELNNMTISVKDIDKDHAPWKITANVIDTEQSDELFSLVWKDSNSSDVEELNGHTIFSSDMGNNQKGIYTKTWNSNEGILLKTKDYVPIGTYANLKVNWSLVTAKSAD